MALRLPIVAARRGEGVIERDAAVLASPSSSEMLDNGIAMLLKHRSSQVLIIKAARQRALETFLIETMIAHYAALYQEVRSH
jgi:hypothetical protein